MKITGFHLLLTYQCTFECEHCFVWGSPFQSGVMTLGDIRRILQQAGELGSVRSIYFEGGEPFLYYPTLLGAAREAAERGFEVGIVSNAYWAVSEADALNALQPFAGLIQDLSVSSDRFHSGDEAGLLAANAQRAAARLGIPCGAIRIAQPGESCSEAGQGQIPEGESGLMYRGRAAAKLAGKARLHPWETFTECPHENLAEPGRVHIDPLGNVHLCQGILLGNLFETPAKALCAAYRPEQHPVVGPLLTGGPAELARRYGVTHAEGDTAGCAASGYADACHLCYEARRRLRARLPDWLGPGQVYGEGK